MDASRNIVAQYTYNAWGEIISSSGSMKDINPFRYRGYYYDSETGFYYLQSRYYDPANHRFINADSYYDTGTGFLGYNMFAYCENNPISYIDSEGTKIVIEEKGLAKVLIKWILMILTDDKIAVVDGQVVIKAYCESPTHYWGTQLIRDLVESEHTVFISFNRSDIEGSRFDASNYEGRDGLVLLDSYDYKIAKTPPHITLAHELIHALRYFQGLRPKYFELYTDGWINEEYATVGLSYWVGLTMYEYDGPTENRIRQEHGLPERLAY